MHASVVIVLDDVPIVNLSAYELRWFCLVGFESPHTSLTVIQNN